MYIRCKTYCIRGYLEFRDKFERNFGALPSRRAKKKLKSVYHYLVNDNEKEARHFYKQLEKELNLYYNQN